MNRNCYRYFDKVWFREHQAVLLLLLNHWALSWYFRWILRIQGDAKGKVINHIEPNAFWFGAREVNGERILVSADFRTHDKFSKRIYYAFRPFWHMLHLLDSLFAWSGVEYSFGFDTLTAYPDAGSGGTTVDGIVAWVNAYETFANIIAGAGNSANPVSAAEYPCGLISADAGNPDKYYHCYRAILTFDTSSLTALAGIVSAAFSWWIIGRAAGLGQDENCVVGATPAANNNLQASDYGQLGTTEYSDSRYLMTGATGQYEGKDFNSTGIGSIAKTGVTAIGVRSLWDKTATFGGTWAAETRSTLTVYFADETGTSNDPKLVVEYSVPLGLRADYQNVSPLYRM